VRRLVVVDIGLALMAGISITAIALHLECYAVQVRKSDAEIWRITQAGKLC
jgi:hypothetical protein